jgi:hypothetical protein
MKRLFKTIPLVVFLLSSLVVTPAFALPAAGECKYRCNRTVDTAACVEGSRGGRDCQVVQNCTQVGFIHIGNGIWVPAWECSYNCQIEYCVWV